MNTQEAIKYIYIFFSKNRDSIEPHMLFELGVALGTIQNAIDKKCEEVKAESEDKE